MTDKRKISDLIPDHANANKGTERGRQALEASLRKYGAGRSIVLDKDGRIIAGNKTIDVAAGIGIEDIIVVQTDGTKIVAVQRTDLDIDSPEGRGLAYADNRVGQLSLDWDAEQVLADLNAGMDLSVLWRQDELDELLADLQPKTTGDTEPEIDRAEELRQKWGVEPGQLWQLGEHRLICGDCTDASVVARVMGGERADMMFTDPPYGVGYTGGHFHSGDVRIRREREKLEGDDTPAMYDKFLPVVLSFVDGPCYMWFADRGGKPVYDAVLSNGCEIHAMIVWHKVNATYAAMNAQYKQRHEPCLYFKPKKSTLRWIGPSDECTVWEIKRDAQNEYHPTQKPIELATRAIGNHSVVTVLDCFLGSGTTLIACENLGRRCRAVEISSAYVAVALERWATHTGKTPILIPNSTT